jgi:hypothetical protein
VLLGLHFDVGAQSLVAIEYLKVTVQKHNVFAQRQKSTTGHFPYPLVYSNHGEMPAMAM